MNFDSDMDDASRCGGGNTSATPSITLLNQKLGTSPAPRMLEPSEIELLRKSKEEVLRVTRGGLGKTGPRAKWPFNRNDRSILTVSRPVYA